MNQWREAIIYMNRSTFALAFDAWRSSVNRGFVVVDDISITEGLCTGALSAAPPAAPVPPPAPPQGEPRRACAPALVRCCKSTRGRITPFRGDVSSASEVLFAKVKDF